MVKKSKKTTSKKVTTKRVYTSNNIQTAVDLKTSFGWSVRKIGKELSIPKSVIGRWVKDPLVWRRNYDFAKVRKQKPGMSKELYKEFKKMEKKILKAPLGRQSELTVHFIDDDDDFTLESM